MPISKKIVELIRFLAPLIRPRAGFWIAKALVGGGVATLTATLIAPWWVPLLESLLQKSFNLDNGGQPTIAFVVISFVLILMGLCVYLYERRADLMMSNQSKDLVNSTSQITELSRQTISSLEGEGLPGFDLTMVNDFRAYEVTSLNFERLYDVSVTVFLPDSEERFGESIGGRVLAQDFANVVDHIDRLQIPISVKDYEDLLNPMNRSEIRLIARVKARNGEFIVELLYRNINSEVDSNILRWLRSQRVFKYEEVAELGRRMVLLNCPISAPGELSPDEFAKVLPKLKWDPGRMLTYEEWLGLKE